MRSITASHVVCITSIFRTADIRSVLVLLTQFGQFASGHDWAASEKEKNLETARIQNFWEWTQK